MTKLVIIKQNIKPNRLINGMSPYLLKYDYNPVNLFPWGEETFQKAKEEEKLIFLSPVYAVCHWGHVHKRYNSLIPSLFKYKKGYKITPSNLTTAVSNMETAYTDAYTALYTGNISSKTLTAGVPFKFTQKRKLQDYPVSLFYLIKS